MWNFRPRALRNPIAKLYRRDKDAWRRKFFPEYDGLPFTGYRITYNPFTQDQPRRYIRANYPIPELQPWNAPGAWMGLDIRGVIWKFEHFINRGGKETIKRYPVEISEPEYQIQCDRINYFRNGGRFFWRGISMPGLNPRVFEGGGFYIQDDLWQEQRQNPEYIHPCTTKAGYYFKPSGARTLTRPWGSNSFFFPYGSREPTYISQIWGPHFAADDTRAPNKSGRLWFEESEENPRPDQEQYDREDWEKATRSLPW